ncbi:MAG: hypothetical protein ACLQAH_13735 [Limisphaerales bacterium]
MLSGKVKKKPENQPMDFDEVMRRVVRVKPEKAKKPTKRKKK